MLSVVETVVPFERRHLPCEEKGEFSEPVVSQFGVHLIQLVAKTSRRGK